MLKPAAPTLRRSEVRPGDWGQWLVTGAAGLVGFVVLALLLVFETGIGQLDHELLAGVISLRSPDLTAFASAVTWLLGLHWPSDVLGGWLLATTMVSLTMALVNLALIPYPGETVPDVHPGAIDDATRQLTLQQAGRAVDSAGSQLE